MSKKVEYSSAGLSSRDDTNGILDRAVNIIGKEIGGGGFLVMVEDPKPEAEANKNPFSEAMTRLTDSTPFGDELKEALLIREEAASVIRNIMLQASSGSIDDIGGAKAIVEKIADSIYRNQDSMVSLLRVKEDMEQYSTGHSLNVTVLAIAIGRQMGLSRKNINLLGLAAIFCNIGMTLIPEALLTKSGPLTDGEFSTVKEHTRLGSELLSSHSGLPGEVLTVATEHHERYDGSGYERGLKGGKIALFSRVVAIADVYDAATTKRPYGETISPADAVGLVCGQTGKQFDKRILDKFFQCLGRYPIGSFVKLNTGEVALVRGQNRENLLRPNMLPLFDKEGLRYNTTLDFDLLKEGDKHIISSVDSSNYKVNVDDYLI